MMRAKPLYSGENNTIEPNVIWGYMIMCPGCKSEHVLTTNPKFWNDGDPWIFNGDKERPTFNPSLLIWKDNPDSRCHSFIKNGQIQFLGDCGHELKNQTIDLPEIA